MIICNLTMGAQKISVSNFRLLETDLTANTPATMERDQNGEVAALIKVMTTETGFVFDGGALGIVKAVQKTGEVWVYVPRGTKKITISHPRFGFLRDHYLPMPVEAAKTYEMVLTTGVLEEINSQERTSQYVVFRLSPPNAVVELDGEQLQTIDGTAMKIMEFGTYNYQVQAPYCLPEAGIVTVNDPENKHEINIVLEAKAKQSANQTIRVGKVSFNMILVDGVDHQVVPSPFYVGETEVTQELWEAVMGNNPSKFKGKNKPVEKVSYYECLHFIKKLNEMTGYTFRLPTKAEWEFAARGGDRSQKNMYSGSNSIDDVAWYKNNSNKTTHDVKSKQANELGLYDMSGNVSERCQDGVYRGGHWNSDAVSCRILASAPKYTNKFNYVGFRLACSSF
jgi:hypothetical protein